MACALLLNTAAVSYLNVNGGALSRCSERGMALTGFTRNGQCIDQFDDTGSHHICIAMKSNAGGNFCQVTGQPNWCDSSMRCDSGIGMCPVDHWCVCQWAFASYLQHAGGCGKIQQIVCEATNREAYLAYEQQAANDPQIARALDCLVERCHVNTTKSGAVSMTNTPDLPQQTLALMTSPSAIFWGVLLTLTLIFACCSGACCSGAQEPQLLGDKPLQV